MLLPALSEDVQRCLTNCFAVADRHEDDAFRPKCRLRRDHRYAEFQSFSNAEGIAIVERGAQENVGSLQRGQRHCVCKIAVQKNASAPYLGSDQLRQVRVQTARPYDEQPGVWMIREQFTKELNLQWKIVFALQQSDGHEQRTMLLEKALEGDGQWSLVRLHARVRRDYMDPGWRHAGFEEELANLFIDCDEFVKEPEQSAFQRACKKAPAFVRGREAAGMERENGFGSGQDRAECAKREQTSCKITTDVEVNDVAAQSPDKF